MLSKREYVILDLNQRDIIIGYYHAEKSCFGKAENYMYKKCLTKKFLPKNCPGAVGFFMKHVMIRKWTQIKYSKKAQREES
jgi:hypothetical protein